MNIRIDSREHAALYAGSDCPFCGRHLPMNGACACGVWKRTPIATPSFLVELTADGPTLAHKEGYYSEQYAAVKREKEAS